MPTFTTKIQWRSSTPTRTKSAFMGLIKDHFQSSGVSWSILDDQTSAATNPYIVVTKDRGTGVAGENIIALLQYKDSANAIYFRSFSAWDAATKTGTNGDSYGDISGSTRFLTLSLTTDMDFFISTDSNFIVATSKTGATLTTQSRHLIAISAFERYANDADIDSFYGGWELADPTKVWVPVFSGSTGTDRFLNCGTLLGGATSLSSVNEAGNDVIFPFYVNRANRNKHKGELYGVRIATNSASVTEGTVTPVIDGTAWMIVKAGTNQSWAMAVGTGDALSTVS